MRINSMDRYRELVTTSHHAGNARRTFGCIPVAALVLLSTACAAPFAEMQSARLAGKGRVELTPAYSYVDFVDDGESAKLQDTYGVHVATGLSNGVDLRMRVEHIRVEFDDESFTATAVGLGPKFGLIPDVLALYTPFGFAFGDGIEQSETWQFHPAIIWTIPVTNGLEINSSFKALIPLSSDDEDTDDILTALNFGLGLGPDLSQWVIRPEIGFLKNPGESGTVRHFSLGLTFFLGERR